MAAATIDWTERLPWDHEDPDHPAKHPSVQRLTDAQIRQRIKGNRMQLEEAEGFTYEQAEEVGEDLDAYRESIRERIATHERALALRAEYAATAEEAR